MGEPVAVTVMAFPNRKFRGKIWKIHAGVDPIAHRATVRSEIADPESALRPGMVASFVNHVKQPVKAIAIPVDGVVPSSGATSKLCSTFKV